jgi:hypothetical protein
MAAGNRLEPVQSGTRESPPAEGDTARTADPTDEELARLLADLGKDGGVSDGVRTRDFRSHSPTRAILATR